MIKLIFINIKIRKPNVANQTNHWPYNFKKDPLSMPFHGMKVYVAKVTSIKNSNKFVKVI